MAHFRIGNVIKNFGIKKTTSAGKWTRRMKMFISYSGDIPAMRVCTRGSRFIGQDGAHSMYHQ